MFAVLYDVSGWLFYIGMCCLVGLAAVLVAPR